MITMRTLASAADLAACSALLRQGSKSFHLASRLLPPRIRVPAAAVYAFCRQADDAVDLEAGGAGALDALGRRLDRVYAARPADDPVERALADVVAAFGIPRALLDALIEGLAWDEAGRRYADLGALRAYSARVAGTVGVITTLLMGVRRPATLARAADLGVAMQLTNIARDVGEDARAGRLYLPASWMRAAGLCPDAWLERPVFDQRLATVVARLLQAAATLYQRSAGGIADLPPDCRIGIHAARLLYAEIGQEVARRGHDSLSGRAVVPTGRKLRLLTAACASALSAARPRGGEDRAPPPLAETRFLIEAVLSHPADLCGDAPGPAIAWWHVGARVTWTIELFTRLELEERLQRGRR
jgi:phytoene synthase